MFKKIFKMLRIVLLISKIWKRGDTDVQENEKGKTGTEEKS